MPLKIKIYCHVTKLTYYNYTHPITKVFRYEYLTDFEKFIDKETTNLQKLQIEIQSTFYKAKIIARKSRIFTLLQLLLSIHRDY